MHRDANRGKENSLDMGDLQARASPRNALIIIRNEQDSDSSPLRFESARRLSPISVSTPSCDHIWRLLFAYSHFPSNSGVVGCSDFSILRSLKISAVASVSCSGLSCRPSSS